MPLTVEADQQIRSALDTVTDPAANTGIAGLVFCAIDKSGNYLSKHASGNIGLDAKTPMDMDTIFWIASCTKMITGIACMQLVEQGKLDLDSSQQLYEICPELKAVKVLNDKGQLEDKNKEITLRMLLAHIAGFGYSFFSTKLRDVGINEISGNPKDYLDQPLINQPGTVWEYGMNIDWAGICVERITGVSLNEYFQKNIFQPLGIKEASFFPSEHMKQHMVKSHQRDSNGVKEVKVHPYDVAISASVADQSEIFQSGGAGCFAKPSEYCLILAALLNDGTSPNTGIKILEKETVNEMFTNQIPEFPDFARRPTFAAKPELVSEAPEMYPQEGNPPQGWGLTFFITIAPGATGRGANTAWWAGIANLFYWVDREKGVAGMIAGQTLPFGDLNILGAWVACETAIYNGLT